MRIRGVDDGDAGRAGGGEKAREWRNDGLGPFLILGTAGVGDRATGIDEIVGHVDDEHCCGL